MYLGHFTKLNSFEKILQTKWLNFGSIARTNDPFENDNLLNTIYTQTENGTLVFSHPDCFSDITNYKEEFKFLSFTCSENSEDIVNKSRMWEQYGDSHNGCCLIFDKVKFDSTFDNNDNISEFNGGYGELKLEKASDWVDYSLREDQAYIKRLVSKISRYDNEQSFKEYKKNLIDFIWKHKKDFLLKKVDDWSNEREYRYLLKTSATKPVKIEFRSSLKEIILGFKVNPENVDFIKNWGNRQNIKLFQMELDSGFLTKRNVDHEIFSKEDFK